MRPCSKFLLLLLFLGSSTAPVLAQWTTQTIQLRPGWNAVFLEVQPDDNRCETVLAGLPVETVMRWNRRFNSVQFISDPNRLIEEPEAWLIWISGAHPIAGKSSLYRLDGGRPYLIRTTNTTVVSWSVKGQPVRHEVEWLGDSLNLAGFHLSAANTATFQNFFGGAAGVTNASLYRLNTSGIWSLATAAATMQRGEAFWVRPQGLPDFQGPLEVQLSEGSGIHFGTLLPELSFSIHNRSTSVRPVVVRQLASENPPPSSTIPFAGSVPLSYWQNEFALGRAGWTNFPAQLSSNIPPGGTWEVRLSVRRADLDTYVPPPGVSNYLFQSLLEVTEPAANWRRLLPVTAEPSIPAVPAAGGIAQAGVPDAKAGLWIGQASINRVSQPASASPTTPVATGSEFSFRVLVHVDAEGEARLLQKVLQMWSPGTYKLAEDGSTNLVVDQPGRFVLLTHESQAAQYTGAALRDGQPVARRFSSAAFDFRDPLLMNATGDFGVAPSQFSCTVLNDYREPRNPFVHAYHPDHNNLNDRFDAMLPEGREAYTVTRTITLEFTAEDPDHLGVPGWGDTRLGGIYRETISGLHKAPLHLQGTFTLHRASSIPELN